MGVSLPSFSVLALPSRLSLKRETDVWTGARRLTEKMTPAAITASFNLPLYDAEYARLQAELQEVRFLLFLRSLVLRLTLLGRHRLSAA